MIFVLWFTLAVALLLTLAAVLFVASPLWKPARPLIETDDSPLAELIRRKDTTLRAIKEVEFDHSTGKLSDEDFHRYDQRLRQQAIALMRQIEKHAPDMPAIEDELEALIAAKRGEAPSPTVQPPSQVRACPKCGAPARDDANFCARCGAPLALPAVSPEPAQPPA